MRFISSLTQQEITLLQEYIRSSANHWERMRAQAILWSHKGYKLKTIADLCEVDRDTVSRWRPPRGLQTGSKTNKQA